MKLHSIVFALACGFGLLRLSPPASAETLYRFTFPLGVGPAALVRGADGAFYGITQRGGAFGQGGVFRVAPGSAAQAVYSFGAAGGDGNYPTALIEDSRDTSASATLRFYGTTRVGGASKDGTVFLLVVDAGSGANPQERILHSFGASGAGDGTNPAALAQAHDGTLYGAAPHGAQKYGALFHLTTAGTGYAVVHAFNSLDGAQPMSAPTEDVDHAGTFYGVTRQGGKTGSGTVYEFTASNSRLSTLHSFAAPDGYFPSTPLVQSTAHDVFYGATASDPITGAGTLFRVSRTGQLVTTHFFNFDKEGGSPDVLIPSGDGAFYVATASGGARATKAAGGSGSVLRFVPGLAPAPIYSFPRAQGSNPTALILAGGSLYGTANAGGLYSAGVVFSLPPVSNAALTTLHAFSAPDGTHPVASLVQGSDGFLYGSTSTDGTPPPDGMGNARSGTGTLFRLEPDSSGTGFHVVTVHSFSALHSSDSTNGGGAFPQTALTEDANNPGAWYGVTEYGGESATGTVFHFVPGMAEKDSAFDTLHSFAALSPDTYANAEGAYPAAPLLQQGSVFYGTALYGGALGNGTVFRVAGNGTRGNEQVSSVHSFTFSDGAYPAAGLIADRAGALYGTTGGGGKGQYGTVFSLTAAGDLTLLHSFAFTDGAAPQAALALALDNAGREVLCGTTFYGGDFGFGTTFQQVTSGADFNTLHSFTDGMDGGSPQAALLVIPFAASLTSGGPNGIHIGGYRTAGAAYIGGSVLTEGGGGRRLPNLRRAVQPAGDPGTPESADGRAAASAGGATAQAVSSGSAPPSGGTVFVQNSDGTGTRPVVHFGGQSGSNPAGALVKASDGYYYGTTEYGGAGAGTIYRIALPMIDDAAPQSPPAGTALTLTVAGSGFVKGSRIYWNGTALITAVKSPALLTATVPTSVNTAGTVTLQVAAPDGSAADYSPAFVLRRP